MLRNPYRRRILGVVMLLCGISGALLMYFVRESYQPAKGNLAWGYGYLTDGWGDALSMFKIFIVLGVIVAVAGLILILTAPKR